MGRAARTISATHPVRLDPRREQPLAQLADVLLDVSDVHRLMVQLVQRIPVEAAIRRLKVHSLDPGVNAGIQVVEIGQDLVFGVRGALGGRLVVAKVFRRVRWPGQRRKSASFGCR